MEGFKKFILRGNVVDLAVGIVIGAAFTSVVNAFVSGLLTPLIGVVGGVPNFSNLKFTINHSVFNLGGFLNALLSFLIMSAVVYFFVIMPLNKLTERMKKDKKVEAPTTRECPYCLSTIPLKAIKCSACTADLKTPKK